MELWQYEKAKKLQIIAVWGDEYIAVNPEYVWPDDNEENGGEEALMFQIVDGSFTQLNISEIASIKILE